MKIVKIFTILAALALGACATGTAANTAPVFVPADKSAIMGSDWYLTEIRSEGAVTSLNRLKLQAEGNEDTYSLRFDEKNGVFGKAAPNTYRGPCHWGSGSALTFGPMALTMVASKKEPPAGLEEHAYFKFLREVKSWGLTAEDRLGLNCEDESGRVIMVFER
ncbi:MAG: META domain-containing protein [Treponema sp.]|jgi:heat shock protein HslJ|nr:META domain-containing protein [Treponema sp.]